MSTDDDEDLVPTGHGIDEGGDLVFSLGSDVASRTTLGSSMSRHGDLRDEPSGDGLLHQCPRTTRSDS